ncbi:hypothetical protein KM043_000666 [Ampulex compressa]|nr:hypothetical protein KM043_000666 [Ampulex compressa]
MSLIPLMFSNWWEDLDRPHRLLDQNFGLGLFPDQLPSPAELTELLCPGRNRQLRMYIKPSDLLREKDSGSSVIKADKDSFQVMLDVQQFEPNEIDVKVVDRSVVITAKHDEKRDEHGWISRQFVRKYIIPEQCDIEQVSSSLSSDGILSIVVPRKDKPKIENERTIKIERTGKPALHLNQRKQESEEEKEASK